RLPEPRRRRHATHVDRRLEAAPLRRPETPSRHAEELASPTRSLVEHPHRPAGSGLEVTDFEIVENDVGVTRRAQEGAYTRQTWKLPVLRPPRSTSSPP